LVLALASAVGLSQARQIERDDQAYVIAGWLLDKQGSPVVDALVSVRIAGEDEPLAETESQEDGNWALMLEDRPTTPLNIDIVRPHFNSEELALNADDMGELLDTGTLGMGGLTLQRQITVGFWAATIIFVAVLLIIAFEKMHSTTAALFGISAVFLLSFIAVAFYPPLYVINFERALTYINWEVIFLVMAMMIVIAVIAVDDAH
jgi:hypothetical protein